MEPFATWIIVDDRSKDLEQILKPELKKKFFFKKLKGNGVEVQYQFRIIKSHPCYEPINGLRIELHADEVDIARPIYKKIKRWINGMQKDDLKYEYSPNEYLNNDVLFELNKH